MMAGPRCLPRWDPKHLVTRNIIMTPKDLPQQTCLLGCTDSGGRGPEFEFLNVKMSATYGTPLQA